MQSSGNACMCMDSRSTLGAPNTPSIPPMQTPAPITLDDIDAALNGPTIAQCAWASNAPAGPVVARAAWVEELTGTACASLPLEELLEIAAEVQPGGALATIQGLLRGLIARHQGDDVTLAALVAIERLHLPRLIEHAA